jgi:hypothetical protein
VAGGTEGAGGEPGVTDMTQMTTGPGGGEGPARDDIYTVLIIVATAFVWIAALLAIIRSVVLFGSLLPPAGG